jgi:hypothetical protein
MSRSKVSSVLDWPPPKNVRELQSSLGFANFYRRFIRNYSGVITLLKENLKKHATFRWTEQCGAAFQKLKEQFTSAPVLAHYRDDRERVLETDASEYAIGGVMSQKNEAGEVHPVAFMSRKLIAVERNYDTYDGNCWQSSRRSRYCATTLKGCRTLRSGPITGIWSTSARPGRLAEDKRGVRSAEPPQIPTGVHPRSQERASQSPQLEERLRRG